MQMPARLRILAVEDDRDLLELTGAILGQENDIACECTAASALRRIASEAFDLLITDLNIAGAGDGLLLSGAMRYLQPGARTVLITGYPDFTHSLVAMQATLDLILLKPVEVEALRQLPRQVSSAEGRKALTLGHESLWSLLRRSQTEVLSAWLKLVESDPELAQIPLSASDRLDHVGEILTDLAGHGAQASAQEAAAQQHGHVRHGQSYQAEWIAKELSFLRRAIFEAVLRDLLHLDLSMLATQLFELDSAVDTALLRSLQEFGLLARPPA
ncbi:MAG: response regulator [Terriglobales bacterium]